VILGLRCLRFGTFGYARLFRYPFPRFAFGLHHVLVVRFGCCLRLRWVAGLRYVAFVVARSRCGLPPVDCLRFVVVYVAFAFITRFHLRCYRCVARFTRPAPFVTRCTRWFPFYVAAFVRWFVTFVRFAVVRYMLLVPFGRAFYVVVTFMFLVAFVGLVICALLPFTVTHVTARPLFRVTLYYVRLRCYALVCVCAFYLRCRCRLVYVVAVVAYVALAFVARLVYVVYVYAFVAFPFPTFCCLRLDVYRLFIRFVVCCVPVVALFRLRLRYTLRLLPALFYALPFGLSGCLFTFCAWTLLFCCCLLRCVYVYVYVLRCCLRSARVRYVYGFPVRLPTLRTRSVARSGWFSFVAFRYPLVTF